MSILELPLRGAEYCMIDLETTGLTPGVDQIVEVAAIRFDGQGRVLAEYHSLVNPRMRVRATEIHGIADADVADAPTLAEVTPGMLPLLSGAVVLAYNAYFDMGFLQRAWRLEVYPFACAMYLRGMLGLSPARLPLEQACAQHGVTHPASHCAGDDAHATRLLFTEYLALADERGLTTFGDLARVKQYKFTSTWRYPLLAVPPIRGRTWAKPRYVAQAGAVPANPHYRGPGTVRARV